MLKVKKSFREDWTGLSAIVALGAGFVIALLDFVFFAEPNISSVCSCWFVFAANRGILAFQGTIGTQKESGIQ